MSSSENEKHHNLFTCQVFFFFKIQNKLCMFIHACVCVCHFVNIDFYINKYQSVPQALHGFRWLLYNTQVLCAYLLCRFCVFYVAWTFTIIYLNCLHHMQVKSVWIYKNVSEWWQNLYFWVICSFKLMQLFAQRL